MSNSWRHLSAFILWCLVVAALLPACSEDSRYRSAFSEGRKAFDQGRYAQARDYFGRALKAKPSDRDALYYMGMAYRRDFMYDSALVYLQRANLLHPKDRPVLKELYDVAKALNDWEVLYTAISGLIGSGDPEEEHWEEMGQVWAYRDYPANALYYTAKALTVKPEKRILYIRAAELADIVEGPDSALHIIDSAIARFGVDEVLLANRAEYLDKAGYPEEAEKIYRSALSMDSTRDDIRYNLALSLLAQDNPAKWREAREIFQRLKPRYGGVTPIDSLLAEIDGRLER